MTHDTPISVSDLAATLSHALSVVQGGESLVVTRHGVPIARIVPVVTGAESVCIVGSVNEERAAYEVASAPLEGALAQLMTTPALRRVLAVFVLDPAVEVHQREIARRAGAGLRSAQIALQRLVAMGLLDQRRDGNRLYYRASRSPRFRDVRELFGREFGIPEVLARHLGSLGSRVRWAFIFGSVVNGTSTIDSDVDLVVVGDVDDDDLVAPIAAAQRELGREIDVVNYREDEFAAKRAQGNHFILSVLQQPRYDVIGGDHDA